MDAAESDMQDDDQVPSQDEYEITLAEGIEDESLLDNDSGIKQFSITSYGADYTVDSLVKRMNAGAFKIPSFQRRFLVPKARFTFYRFSPHGATYT